MSKVIEFTGDYTQPPHMAKRNDWLGCGECGGFTFLLAKCGSVVCNSCGTVMTDVSLTLDEQVA